MKRFFCDWFLSSVFFWHFICQSRCDETVYRKIYFIYLITVVTKQVPGIKHLKLFIYKYRDKYKKSFIGVWSSASGLNFIEHARKNRRARRSAADLNIAFRRRNHECGHARAFDGPGGELAHGKHLNHLLKYYLIVTICLKKRNDNLLKRHPNRIRTFFTPKFLHFLH